MLSTYELGLREVLRKLHEEVRVDMYYNSERLIYEWDCNDVRAMLDNKDKDGNDLIFEPFGKESSDMRKVKCQSCKELVSEWIEFEIEGSVNTYDLCENCIAKAQGKFEDMKKLDNSLVE